MSKRSKKKRDAKRKIQKIRNAQKKNTRSLVVNRAMPTRVMIQCSTKINRDAVSRKSVNGVEHIVITSMTLPDNIVMNGGLYPAEEIKNSFHTLERTLAPVEHPQDGQGNYISANDPEAIHNYHAGAFNLNVEHIDGRVKIDKHINVQEALKSERGKRLLDRITELEESDDPRPIHTSVGVWLTIDELKKPATNAQGQKYTWVAKDMVFDHDAILLDSVGAAQPDQGVGMAVNRRGDKVEVQNHELSPDKPVHNAVSESERRDAIMKALEDQAIGVTWIEEIFEDKVIFSAGDTLFSVPYRIDDVGIVTIVGIPLTVKRIVTYTPITNSEKGDDMKDLIINALKAAGIETNDLDDAQLIEKYNEMLSANSDAEDAGSEGTGTEGADLAEVVANALKPVTEKLEGLEAKLNEKDTAEVDRLADVVANSGKYPGLDADSAKILPIDKLKEMAANCSTAYGINPTIQANSETDEKFAAPVDMPE